MPTLLIVQLPLRAYDEEIFGPVALVLRARDEPMTWALPTIPASASAAVSGAATSGAQLRIEARQCFARVSPETDPRLPFGGIKASATARELSGHGIHEFVNAKTV